MSAIDPFSIIMSFILAYGKLLFAVFGLGLSYFVSKTISGMLFTFSILCFFLFFLYSDYLFIGLASLSLIIGFIAKQIGQ